MKIRSRRDVYKAIDSERTYQEERWGDRFHSVTEYILYMEHHLELARQLASTQDQGVPVHHNDTLDCIRKVAALGVVCMEENGAPHREGYG